MSEEQGYNARIIAEFRENEGRVGGHFTGAPLVLVHHKGRKSGRDFVNPMMCLPDAADPDTVYVFATNGGAPANPAWYFNVTATDEVTVERGTETYRAAVRELHGEERDRVYAEQARLRPPFAEYEEKTAGIRTIPVVALTRVQH